MAQVHRFVVEILTASHVLDFALGFEASIAQRIRPFARRGHHDGLAPRFAGPWGAPLAPPPPWHAPPPPRPQPFPLEVPARGGRGRGWGHEHPPFSATCYALAQLPPPVGSPIAALGSYGKGRVRLALVPLESVDRIRPTAC